VYVETSSSSSNILHARFSIALLLRTCYLINNLQYCFYIVQASPVTFYRLNFPVTSVSSSRTWLMESGELISHGMFGAPDLRIITICRAGAPFLATDFPRLSFRQPLRRPFGALSLSFPGNCPLCGCLGWQWTGERWLQTVAQQCEL